MSLAVGARLGPYEITAPLGAGGMGEVYRARDGRVKRDVAIKVLRAELGADAERIARFQREAEVLGGLNHPHIAHLYGFEETPEGRALVMELVEGPTLADRLAAGPIAWSEAQPIALQLCETLGYAHERGVIHRDLKPANIKLTSDGVVKVLDFGLAKLGADGSNQARGADVLNSPTITTPAMSHAGMILGTAAYMSGRAAVHHQHLSARHEIRDDDRRGQLDRALEEFCQ